MGGSRSEKPSNFLLMMFEKSEKHEKRGDEGKQSDKLIGLEGTWNVRRSPMTKGMRRRVKASEILINSNVFKSGPTTLLQK